MTHLRVDLNCDVGEGIGSDEALLEHVTSANIACGFHAGDPFLMHRTLELAAERGVAAGAHPGTPDMASFGRQRMRITPEQAYDIVAYQVGALLGIAAAIGIPVTHVKPHGALYNMAAEDAILADAIARSVRDIDASLTLYGLAGSALVSAGDRLGLRTASEVFSDRGYEPDGSLTPRGTPGALISDAAAAAERAVRMVLEQRVSAGDGSIVAVHAETICVHGDGPAAVDTALLLRQRLEAEGVRVVAPHLP
jgi:5-oxoprolinase (ATP-hydrolysing) subunit A